MAALQSEKQSRQDAFKIYCTVLNRKARNNMDLTRAGVLT